MKGVARAPQTGKFSMKKSVEFFFDFLVEEGLS